MIFFLWIIWNIYVLIGSSFSSASSVMFALGAAGPLTTDLQGQSQIKSNKSDWLLVSTFSQNASTGQTFELTTTSTADTTQTVCAEPFLELSFYVYNFDSFILHVVYSQSNKSHSWHL